MACLRHHCFEMLQPHPCLRLSRIHFMDHAHCAGSTFDAVTALEVIEHVADPQGFLASLAALAKPWGAVCLSTLNRTPRSYAVGIVGAERIAGLLPVGTHDWEQFLTPGAVTRKMAALGSRG